MCVCMCGLFLCDLNLTTSAVRAASGTFVREWLLCARVCPCLFLLSLVSLCCNKKFESRHSLSGSTENADSGAFIMHIGAVTFWPPMSPMKRFRLSLLSNFAFSLSLVGTHLASDVSLLLIWQQKRALHDGLIGLFHIITTTCLIMALNLAPIALSANCARLMDSLL